LVPYGQRGSSEGLTKSQAEVALRRLIEHESRPRLEPFAERPRTLDEVVELLRHRIAIQGARRSYQLNRESMPRIHISPAFGSRPIDRVTRDDVERLARSMLQRGLALKTVRNVMSFLHAAFALAEERHWVQANPVARAVRPLRRRGDANPDLR
jgi:hypothetical protein